MPIIITQINEQKNSTMSIDEKRKIRDTNERITGSLRYNIPNKNIATILSTAWTPKATGRSLVR
jgi:hypothetical protein